MALAGSWARGEPHSGSDVDLVVLTDDPAAYVESDAWTPDFGGELVATRRWGVLVERRLRAPDGLAIDVGFVEPSWASTDPLDPGTARVAAGGLEPVYDPQGLLAALGELT